MTTPLRVLILEDRLADAELMVHELRRAGFAPDWQRVETEAEYAAALRRDGQPHGGFDVILADYVLPQFNALRALHLLQGWGLDIPFIVVTGSVGEEVAVECMREGAADYLLKDRMARLGPAVERALEEKRLRDEKLEADKALQESEERYRGLFEGVPIGLYRTTPEGRILDANPALVAMLGYPDRQTLMATKVIDGYEYPEERRSWRSLIEREGEVRGYETTWRRYDGTSIWVRESARAVRDVEGQVLYYEGAVEDITERKRAEEALWASEVRYRSLFENSPIALSEEDLSEVRRAIVGLRESGVLDLRAYLEEHPEEVRRCAGLVKILDVNYETLRLFGAESKEQLRQGMDRVFTDVSYNVFREELIALAAGETRFRSETAYRTLQGDDVYAALSLVVAPGHEETWSKVVVSILDISERVRAERGLQRYAERLRALHAIDGAILAAWSREEIAGAALRHIRRLVPCLQGGVLTFDRESQEVAVLATYKDGEVRAGSGRRLSLEEIGGYGELERGKILVVDDILALSPTGPFSEPPRPPPPIAQSLLAEGLRAYITVPLIAQGELIGLLNLGADEPGAFTSEHVDIAREVADQVAVGLRQAHLHEQLERQVVELERRVAERTAELSVANAELARAARLKDEFLAAMSHELRTPLNAILGLSEALQTEVYGPLNGRQLKSLCSIEESGRHLLSLINDILDVSKIEADKLELAIGPVSVESVCQASLGLVKQDAHRKRLSVSTSLDGQVTTIQADARRLKQILVNLLSNAVKFTPEGGAIGLEVVGDVEGQAVRFTVWDTGIGIAPEDMGRLFKPFVQLDSRLSRQHAGTGLGLVLVHRMAEMHGGGVTVESELGKGSRFTVSLPWKAVEESGEVGAREGEGEESAGPSAPVSLPPCTPATLLLAEDNEANIQTISDYLLVRGYQVTVARNGAEAIERAVERRPDLILMDIQMPGMDGLEAIRRIRAEVELTTVPIIALTALAMPGDRERCLAAGANEYLSKPVSLRGLVREIEAQLSAAREA